tara:strand:+ start:347 stop:556 length:210 start_codon:yes stop_codon:yes gene_type:complete
MAPFVFMALVAGMIVCVFWYFSEHRKFRKSKTSEEARKHIIKAILAWSLLLACMISAWGISYLFGHGTL